VNFECQRSEIDVDSVVVACRKRLPVAGSRLNPLKRSHGLPRTGTGDERHHSQLLL
jgi:hypothetical protein